MGVLSCLREDDTKMGEIRRAGGFFPAICDIMEDGGECAPFGFAGGAFSREGYHEQKMAGGTPEVTFTCPTS